MQRYSTAYRVQQKRNHIDTNLCVMGEIPSSSLFETNVAMGQQLMHWYPFSVIQRNASMLSEAIATPTPFIVEHSLAHSASPNVDSQRKRHHPMVKEQTTNVL